MDMLLKQMKDDLRRDYQLLRRCKLVIVISDALLLGLCLVGMVCTVAVLGGWL